MSEVPKLYGLDAELAIKRVEKYNVQGEKEAMDWIAQVTGLTLATDFWSALKSGMVLCTLMNTIQPGICATFAARPKHWLEEKDNINKYLNACKVYGVPGQDLFSEFDLSESKKDMAPVLQNIFSLARIAQAHGWQGPALGVRYYKSMDDIKRLESKKRKEREEEQIRREEYDTNRANRREQLEEEQREALNKAQMKADRRKNYRRKMRKKRKRTFKPFQEQVTATAADTSAVKYGMDQEMDKRRADQFDLELANRVMDWIEDITEEELDFLWECLRSGRILCVLINKIKPGFIPKVHPPGIAMLERENITNFVKACVSLGVASRDTFDVNDLYHNRDLSSVLRCLVSLSRVASGWYNGPVLVVPSTQYHTDNAQLEASFDDITPVGTPRKPDIGLTGILSPTNGDVVDYPYGFFGRYQARGKWFIALALVVVFLCSGGNYGDLWFRQIILEQPLFFNSTCDLQNMDCRTNRVDNLLIVASSVMYMGLVLSGVLFELLGPKVSVCTGILVKLVGCLLIAISHQSLGLNLTVDQSTYILYAGYILFQIGGSYVLIPSWFIDVPKPYNTAFYGLLAIVFYSFGGWIFCLFYFSIPHTHFYIPFISFAGVLFLLFLVTLIFWPPKKIIPRQGYDPVLSESEKVGDVENIPSFSAITRNLYLHYFYICVLTSILILKGNIFWKLISFGSPLYYGYAVSSICYVLIPISILLERLSNYGNMTIVILLSILDSVFSFVGVQGVEWARVLIYGIEIPFVLAMAVSTIKQKGLWPWFGYAMMPIGLITAALSFIILWLVDHNEDNEQRIREIVLLVVVVLLGLYPLINILRKCFGKKYDSV